MISDRYPYVSHIICNAGVAPFLHISWFGLVKQILINFLDAVTYPRYNVQQGGLMSEDGLGWVWQCNVFGHYILVSTRIYSFANASNQLCRSVAHWSQHCLHILMHSTVLPVYSGCLLWKPTQFTMIQKTGSSLNHCTRMRAQNIKWT